MARPPFEKPPAGIDLVLALESVTGHRFVDHERLQRALTHASTRNADGLDYERFEFLGDRVLGLVVADMLFAAHPKAPEGELSVRLNALVNADTLASIAEEIGLPGMIRVGSELRGMSGRKRTNLYADSLEALIAALYIEGGLEASRAFIHRHWASRAKTYDPGRRDAKTELQEWAHQFVKATPAYEIDDRVGPDHDPIFTVSVRLEGLEPAYGNGRSRREAEQAAATAMLLREGVWKPQEMPV